MSERRPTAAHVTIAPAEPGERMRFAGRVLAADGVTPAANVVVYTYHTNSAGLYANSPHETEWSHRHGRLRGWRRATSWSSAIPA